MGACLSFRWDQQSTSKQSPSLVCWSDRPLARGGDKTVYHGVFKDRPVAIAVAKPGHAKRLLDEIKILRELGAHGNIIELLHYSDAMSKDVFIVLEKVNWDLDRLVNQHTFAGQSLPTALTVHVIRQASCGLTYMHNKGIIHRDLKLQNILINSKHNARLIDMGIACRVGHPEERWVFQRKTYLAPEVCQGLLQTVAVDCWGVGFLFHQIYQKRGDMVDASGTTVKMILSRPCLELPMEPSMKEAMLRLLEFHAADRWTLDTLLSNVVNSLPRDDATGQSETWLSVPSQDNSTNKYFDRYINGHSPPPAFALHVSRRSTPQLINKSIGELKVREKSGCTIVLVDDAGQSEATPLQCFTFRFPGPGLVIREDMWLYVGLPPGGDLDESEREMYNLFKDHYGIEAGLFLPFTLEFDIFEFPKHIGERRLVGPGDFGTALDLRANFKINLAGVLRTGEQEPIWFPGPVCAVSAGDFGLVVRCPCRDGTTVSVIKDEALKGLLDSKSYAAIANKCTAPES